MNAIGERAGNCSVEEVIMAIQTRGASILTPSGGGVTTGADSKQIVRTSRLVSALTGYQVPPNKAIVGANAFAHEAGIHQHGVLMDRTTYEIMDATSVGWDSNRIVLGKHSGRHAFAKTLTDMGYDLSGDDLNRAWSRFRDLVDRKIEMTEADLMAVITDEISTSQDTYVLEDLQVRGGTHVHPSAKVRIRAGDETFEESAEGDGMIDATCGAIQRALGINAKLLSFKVGSGDRWDRRGRRDLGPGQRRRDDLLRQGRLHRRGGGLGPGVPECRQPSDERQHPPGHARRTELLVAELTRSHNLAVVPGDGIGPEVIEGALMALDAVADAEGFALGVHQLRAWGKPVPEHRAGPDRRRPGTAQRA